MRVYKDKKLTNVYCNKCNKQVVVESEIVKEGIFSIDYHWNYFSGKDGEKHSFDICEECYDKLIKDFKIPVEETEYTEFV